MNSKFLDIHTLATIRSMPAVRIARLGPNESVAARAEAVREEHAHLIPAERQTVPDMRAVATPRRSFRPIPRED